MKKITLITILVLLATNFYGQKGDLYVGALGGYVTNYKEFLFGLQSSYHVTDPLEVSLSFIMNPDIKLEESGEKDTKLELYSFNLNMQYYILSQRTWSMAPVIGAQYFLYKEDLYGDENSFGLNLGWNMRYYLTENLKLSGGWKYAVMNHDASHHLFYVGLGYTFNLY